MSRPWLEHVRLPLSRVLLIAAAILGSAVLAYRADVIYVGALLGLAGLAVIIRKPHLGVIALIPVSMLAPVSIGTGTGTEINATIALLAALLVLWLLSMMLRRQVRFIASPVIVPAFAFGVAAILSFLSGQLPWFVALPAPIAAQIGGLALMLLAVGAVILAAHQMQDVRWLRWLTWVFLALGAVYLASRIIPGGRPVTRLFQYGSESSMFWTWIMAVAFSQALVNRSLSKGWRLALFAIVGMAVYIGFFQRRDWTSGWMPGMIAMLIVVWMAHPRLGVLAILVGGVVALFQLDVIRGLVYIGDNEYSAFTRLEAWGILLEIAKVNPVLGLGPANYYFYTPLFPILGYAVSFNSHNNYIDLIAQTGALGLGCFLWFSARLLQVGWRVWRAYLRPPPDSALRPAFFARSSPRPLSDVAGRLPLENLFDARDAHFLHAFVIGAFSGFAATLFSGMLGDWFLPFVYNVGFVGFRSAIYGWLFIGGLVAAAQIIKARQSSSEPAEMPATPPMNMPHRRRV